MRKVLGHLDTLKLRTIQSLPKFARLICFRMLESVPPSVLDLVLLEVNLDQQIQLEILEDLL